MARENHLEIPKALTGYELRPRRSEIEIVIPEGTTNLVTNPGFELATTGWTVGGGTLARVGGDVFRGLYCGKYTPAATAGDGVFFGTITLTAGQAYAFSVRVKGAAGQRYRIFFADTSGAALSAQRSFIATGRWQYVWVVWRETASNSRRVYVCKDTGNTSTQPFYIDDAQVENKAYPTTYCDGDQKGFVRGRADYTWAGRPHQSTSSRSANCAHGGRAVNITKFGFRVLATIGLGFGFVGNRATPLMNGGAIYQGTYQAERQFSVAGVIGGKSQEIRRARADLGAALHANRSGIDQPVLLYITPIERGAPSGETLQIPAVYEGGLQTGMDNDNQSQVTLTFSLYLPYLATGRSQSSVIPWQTVVAPSGGSIVAWKSGGYSVTASAGLNYMKWNPVDGQIYAWAGDRPVVVDPVSGTVTTIAGSSLPVVSAAAIEVLANGDVLWGVGTTYQRYRLATAAWDTALTASAAIDDIAYSPANGYIAVSGQFTTFNAVAANRVIVSTDDGATWAALGAGADGRVRAVAWSLDGDMLYVGGDFNNFASNSSQRFAYWSMSIGGVAGLPLMVATFTGYVTSIAVSADGYVYVAGYLCAVLSGACPDYSVVKLSRTFPPMTVGLATVVNSIAEFIVPGPDGELYVAFSAGGFSGFSGWPGEKAVYVIHDGTVGLFSLPYESANQLTLSVNQRGDVAVAGRTTYGMPASVQVAIDNQSSAESWPTIVMDGPAVLRRIANDTLGVSIDLQLTISADERVYAEFAPDGFRLYSSSRANLLPFVLPGSNLTGFRLTPGQNAVRVFMTSAPVVTGGAPSEWYDYSIGNITAENSDNGKLYISIVDMGTSNRRIDIYKDAGRTQLVAQSNTTLTGVFKLTAQNGSGLTGYMRTSAFPVTLTTTMVARFGLAAMTWPIVHDSIDAAVE